MNRHPITAAALATCAGAAAMLTIAMAGGGGVARLAAFAIAIPLTIQWTAPQPALARGQQ